jgi:aldose 1-epimerase
LIGAGCMLNLLASAAVAADAHRAPFGTLSDGTAIESVELTNAAGLRCAS